MKPTNISPVEVMGESQDLINRPVIRKSQSCPSTLLSLLVMLMKMSTRLNRKKKPMMRDDDRELIEQARSINDHALTN